MSPKTLLRQKKFAAAYVENGCNAKRAYKSISPDVTDRTAEVEGIAYLRKPVVEKMLMEEIEAVPIGYLRKRFMDKSFDAKRDADQLRSLEDLAKLEGLMRDNTITINNANGMTADDVRAIRFALQPQGNVISIEPSPSSTPPTIDAPDALNDKPA